jgi:hypothetical protein
VSQKAEIRQFGLGLPFSLILNFNYFPLLLGKMPPQGNHCWHFPLPLGHFC